MSAAAPAHIVHVITGLGQGGAEAMLHKLLRQARLQPSAPAQEVFALGADGVVGQRLRAEGVPVTALGLAPTLHNPWRLWPLLRRLRQLPRDTVVQTWMYHGDLIGALVARIAGQRRIVWNIRQSGISAGDISRSTRAVVALCARLSHHLPLSIVANAHKAIAVHTSAGYRPDRFVCIGNGFDGERFRPDPVARQRWRQQLGLTADQLLVGNIARDDPQKDLPGFLRMAGQLAVQDERLHFVLAGRGVSDSAALRELSQACGLSGRLSLLGEQAEPQQLLAAMDLFCLSSRAEGFPNVLGEAMCCALPCVTTDCGDAAEVIGDARWVAPVATPEALAQRVQSLLSLTPAQREALGQQLRQRALARFGIATVWQQYLQLYSSL